MQKYPVIKFVIFFILGIVFQHLLLLPTKVLITIFISVTLVSAIIYLLFIKNYTTFPKTIPLLLTVFLFGAVYYSFSLNKRVSYPFNDPKIRNAEIIGEIKSIDLIKHNKLVLKLEASVINGEKFNFNKDALFLCNIWNDSTNSVREIYDRIKIGNKISFLGTINRAKNQRNPGEFNYEDYLNTKGIAGIINCYKSETFRIVKDDVKRIPNTLFNLRRSIDEQIKKLYNPEASALLKGILLADRSDIDYNIKDSFINSGVIHVLAVSGLHVGFISIIFFLLFGRLNIRLKYICTIGGIILFLILTGGHASVFRASTMAILYLISKLTNRSTNGFNSISIAALIILLIDPRELFNPGFLLSFSAVLSILIIYPIFSLKISALRINKYLQNILLFGSVSLAAQLGTLPFTIIYFNKLSVVSLFTNLIVIPIIGLVVAIGLLSLFISAFSIWIAAVIASTNELLISFLYYFISQIGNLSFSFVPLYNVSVLDGVIYYTFLALIFYVILRFKNKTIKFILTILCMVSLYNFIQLDDKSLLPANELSVFTMDVGQGDALLIQFPDKRTALIDAGNLTEYFDIGERVIAPMLQRLEIDKIDYAFVSHLDFDHFGGFIYLINKKLINNVYKPFPDNSEKDKIFEEFLRVNNVSVSYYAEHSLEIGGAKLFFLNDTSEQKLYNFDSNNNSGIIKIVYGKTSFLFVGDAEREAEELLVNKYGEFLKSDVLKIGHHGSETSTMDEFLDFVNPKVGIISAGIMNKFKHPSPKILQKLNKNNINIRRTDKEGAIILASNGETIKNVNWKDF